MLSFVTLLWDANENSQWFSRCYDEAWVVRLYNGVKRNLTRPFRFVLFTDRDRDVPGCIVQERLKPPFDYGACIQPYRMGAPMILVGLDTVITGNIDDLADYCLNNSCMALPRDPYQITVPCNGVALVPKGFEQVHDAWSGENDMEWMRRQKHKLIDLVFPGQVVSYKGEVVPYGLRDARIVYFHGGSKPHELVDLPGCEWIREHWLGG